MAMMVMMITTPSMYNEVHHPRVSGDGVDQDTCTNGGVMPTTRRPLRTHGGVDGDGNDDDIHVSMHTWW